MAAEPWLRNTGLVVKAEDSLVQTPPLRRPLFRHHSFGSKAWSKKRYRNVPTWHCYMCCNPANGRVNFEDGLAYKNTAS